MSKKNRILLLLLFISVLLLPGCLEYSQEVSMNTDGGGTMKIQYSFKYGASDSLFRIDSAIAKDKSGLFQTDSLRKKFTSTKYTLTNIQVWTDTTDTSRHAMIELSFRYLDSLNNSPLFPQTSFHLDEGAEGQRVFEQRIYPFDHGFGIGSPGSKLTYDYYFPGKIIQHNASKFVQQKLIWTFTNDQLKEGKTLTVSYEPYKIKETPKFIYYLSGFVLLLVIFFLLRKRRD